jgi:hypothetical protein
MILGGIIIAAVSLAVIASLFVIPIRDGPNKPAYVTDADCYPVGRPGCGPILRSGHSRNPCDHNLLVTAATLQAYDGKLVSSLDDLKPYVDLGHPFGDCIRPICRMLNHTP